jgi:Rad3-related DNA helicase
MSENIQQQIEKYAIELLGKDFKFREGQLDAIVQIVNNTTNNIKHNMLEAPTGSGKSMIALISAYALYKIYDKKTYILVSDLSLFAQYENDIKKLNSICFGCLKGKENYVCWKNGCNVSQATCSLKGISVGKMAKHSMSFACKEKCQYIKDYTKAIHAPITLMTYQLYFIQRNYVEDILFNGRNKNFPARDLVICDECHKICEICQSHFAPTINIKRPKWMNDLDKGCKLPPYEDHRYKIVNDILNSSTNDDLVYHISCYEQYISRYVGANEELRDFYKNKDKLSKIDRALLYAGNRARQEHCKFDDMLSFISEIGSNEYVTKSVSDNDITINFIFDDIMLKKYFHNKSNNELLMSATIGNFNSYANIAGLDKQQSRAIVIPSTFDFSNSPIVYSTINKMSYTEKDNSIKHIAQQVIDICNKHNTHRGIIQTGSYAHAKTLMSYLPYDILQRCLFYDGSESKKTILNDFLDRNCYNDDNSILIGPTLIEGLNFPDDMCRFQICIKVPYACLGSEYVRKKMEYVNGWYEYDVLNKLCQGIGRGIRHKNDWCKTYILDGCITNLISKLNKFNTLQGRFKKIA